MIELVFRVEISNMNINRESDSPNSLPGRKRKKNDYRKLEAGAYPRMFLQQLEGAATAIAKDDLSTTRMVCRDIRTGKYNVKMGYGERVTWFPNKFLEQGQFAECANAGEAFMAIMRLMQAAREGVFDEALEALRVQRQEHAAKMIEERNVCGFHSLENAAGTDQVGKSGNGNEGGGQ